jgi:NAD(P)-dependent dehydrogenase (short-subunit alcohol dehydrogenase family)
LTRIETLKNKSRNRRIAIVTGASTGIGRAIAIAFAHNNISVALVGRNLGLLLETKKLIERAGSDAKLFIADLSNQDAIDLLAVEINNTYHKVDILANVAGVWHDNNTAFYGSHLDRISSSQITEVLDVNIKATMLLTSKIIPLMKKNKSGKIINISGTFSEGGAGWLHYYVSKLAVENFTKGLSDELKESNIQVNCISPSDVATTALMKYFPEQINFALKPDNVADLAVFLTCSSVANDITGQVIVIQKSIK